MANNSLVVVVRNLTTGAATGGLTVTLRHSLDSFAATAYTATEIPGKTGCYEFTDVSSRYRLKLYVNATEDVTFGGTDGKFIFDSSEYIVYDGTSFDANSKKIINVADPTTATGALNRQTGDGRYLQLSGDTMTGAVNMGNHKITNLDDADDPGDAVNLSTLEQTLVDEDFAKRSGGNTFGGDQTFNGNIEFAGNADFSNNLPTCEEVPTADNQLVNKAYVDDELAALVLVPFQESSNVIRLMPSGTQVTGEVYTTWTGAQTAAAAYATSGRRFIIEIPGGGESSRDITVNSAFNQYVSVKGGNQNVRLLVDDTAYSIGSLGNTIIENITVRRDDDGDGTPSFTNFVFKDCYLDFDTLSLTFVNCDFRGVTKIKNTGSITFTNCKGGIVETNGTLPSTMRGWGGLDTADF